MGVVNVTPDSFYDGGRHLDQADAIAHGLALVDEGADIIDVGGESSRPGAEPVPEAVELARVLPMVEALAPVVRVSVDTAKPVVAQAALRAGATLVNDITASLWEVAAEAGAGWIAMHMQGTPRTMQKSPHYDDVMAEVSAFLLDRAEVARRAGIAEVWLDPGIGFGKTLAHNLSLLHHLPDLVASAAAAGCAGVAIGTSRKQFLGRLVAATAQIRQSGAIEAPPPPAATEERFEGSLATATLAMAAGAGLIRVHDVAATVQAARLYGPAT
jgi:dihydropteroate synthase